MPQRIKGLVPAIVQDCYTGRVLMLAYVNQESYDYMLGHGETCFWSRSRQELWHKGETSGNTQKIKSMAFDCDEDTLLIQVEQQGSGACHTGSCSCFGDNEAGAFHILEGIYAQIEDRKQNPKEKSYTNYLLAEGLDKTCKKLGEEATEVILAAKNGDAAALSEELADLAYHALVLMLQAGVRPREVAATLTGRHQKEGNLKDKNEKGAY
jgi:phosphoribosyl-ATP pyrophosphohydrolase/phosphoribosyl-AMP cyclohydrolase